MRLATRERYERNKSAQEEHLLILFFPSGRLRGKGGWGLSLLNLFLFSGTERELTTVKAPRECGAAGERVDALKMLLVCILDDSAAGTADVFMANAICVFKCELRCGE